MSSPDFPLRTACPAPDCLPSFGPSDEMAKHPVTLGLANVNKRLTTAWNLFCAAASGCLLKPKRQRRLRVSETVSLGDKRFLSIVQVDGQDFLIGGATSGVTLLSRLTANPSLSTYQGIAEEAWQKGEQA